MMMMTMIHLDRVAGGADVTTGTGRGNADCLGSGTGMAGIIAAGSGADDGPIGIAPEATILPIRVVTTAPDAKAADAATAVEVAVSAGAKVIALGSYVDLTAPAVAAAVGVALGHDVLVVAAHPPPAAAAPPRWPRRPRRVTPVRCCGPAGSTRAGSRPSATAPVRWTWWRRASA
jgi:hypothetical protein